MVDIKLNSTTAALHTALIKAYRDPEIVQRLADTLYDNLSKINNIKKFEFNQDTLQFTIVFDNPDDLFNSNAIKLAFVDFVTAMVRTPYTCNILNQYLSNENIQMIDIALKHEYFNILATSCISILNLTPTMSSVDKTYLINLYN